MDQYSHWYQGDYELLDQFMPRTYHDHDIVQQQMHTKETYVT